MEVSERYKTFSQEFQKITKTPLGIYLVVFWMLQGTYKEVSEMFQSSRLTNALQYFRWGIRGFQECFRGRPSGFQDVSMHFRNLLQTPATPWSPLEPTITWISLNPVEPDYFAAAVTTSLSSNKFMLSLIAGVIYYPLGSKGLNVHDTP